MKIVTAVVNNPDFIEIQYHTLKKYFKGEYEFIVFNDAKDFSDFTNGGDITIKTQIKDICNKLSIKCINIPNENHKQYNCAANRYADSMNYILDYQLQNPDKYLLLDSDMFLIDYFDINKYSKYDCAIVLQNRVVNNKQLNYFWPGLCYLDFNKIQNIDLLNWETTTGGDTGSMMQYWLEKQMALDSLSTDETIYFIKHLCSCSWNNTEVPDNIKGNKKLIDFFTNDVRNVNGKFFCEIYDNVFLHYRAGGNWMYEGMEVHKKLTKSLKKILVQDL